MMRYDSGTTRIAQVGLWKCQPRINCGWQEVYHRVGAFSNPWVKTRPPLWKPQLALTQPVGRDSTAPLKAATRTAGRRLPQPVGRDSTAPLKAATGTQGRLISSPLFSSSGYYVSGDLTSKPIKQAVVD